LLSVWLLFLILAAIVVGLIVGVFTMPAVRRFWLWVIVIDAVLTGLGYLIPWPKHHATRWIDGHSAVVAALLWVQLLLSWAAAIATLAAIPGTALYVFSKRHQRKLDDAENLRRRVAELERRQSIRQAAEEQGVPVVPPPPFLKSRRREDA
jgi:membrane protein implicated in regulation of membrane protease activity